MNRSEDATSAPSTTAADLLDAKRKKEADEFVRRLDATVVVAGFLSLGAREKALEKAKEYDVRIVEVREFENGFLVKTRTANFLEARVFVEGRTARARRGLRGIAKLAKGG